MRQRCRLIYEDALTGSAICALFPKDAIGRLLWPCLIMYADDDGRIRADSAYFRHRFFDRIRVSVTAIEQRVCKLRAANMLTLCKVDGVNYYQITNFHQWQRLKKARILRKGCKEKDDDACAHATPPPDISLEKSEEEGMGNNSRSLIERLQAHPFDLGRQKAEVALRAHQHSHGDLDAWEALVATEGIQTAVWGIQRYRHPDKLKRDRDRANRKPDHGKSLAEYEHLSDQHEAEEREYNANLRKQAAPMPDLSELRRKLEERKKKAEEEDGDVEF